MTTALKWQTEAISTQFPLIFHTNLQQRTSTSSTNLFIKKSTYIHFFFTSKNNVKKIKVEKLPENAKMIAQKAQTKMYKQFLLWHPREKFNVNESANNANYPRHRHSFDKRISVSIR